ncbi:unnamed protein product [Absidia cylindrospora]
MPETKEHSGDLKNVSSNHNNDNDADTTNISSTTILRYSKDTLLSLHDSPLVCKPENMPELSSWFGEEAGSPAVSKNMLNGSVVSRSTDKSIVLGPSKTNFASSLYGGLKRTTESNGGTTSGASKLNSRLRQSEDSVRTPNGNHSGNSSNNSGNRMPRGPAYVGEKGFHHYQNNNHHHHHNRHEKTGLERSTSNPFGNQSSHNKRFNHSDHQGERQSTNSSIGGGRREFNRDQRLGNRMSQTNYNDMDRNGQDRVPEWMDYNPTDTKMTAITDTKVESHGDFINDLEAWKSNMKKKEGLESTPPQTQTRTQTSIEASLQPARNNDNDGKDSMDKILDLASLDLTPSSTPLASPMTSIFNSSITSSELPTKRGSRFAKFFAKREEVSQTSSTATSPLVNEERSANHHQPRSINVNDLFQTPGGLPSAEAEPDQILARNDSSTNHLPGQQAPPNVCMLSEEDLLQSMGAKKSVASPEQANQNAIGFNKVLQILSQPKPTAPGSQSPNTNVISSPKTLSVQNIEKQQANHLNEKAASPVDSPNETQRPALNSETSSPSSSNAQLSPAATKPKKVSQLFSGNLPTSVLRQMSARSEGRSPSLSSNKSGHSGRFSHTAPNSQNGSPLNGHASPSSLHLSSTTQQQQQAHSSPIRTVHGYPIRATDAQANTTQSHQSDLGLEGRPMMNNDMMMMMNAAAHRMVPPPHMYQNGEPGMPPHPSLHHHLQHHPQGDGMNRMMSPPSSFNQQQALGDRSYMSPHHQPLPPAMMGIPGQHPMMSPHLPMHLQGAPVHGLRPPPPPPFMQPPPPPPPGPPLMPGMPQSMGMPQHMYTSKTQGWNSQ